MSRAVLALCLAALPAVAAAGEPPRPEKGTFRFTPTAGEADVPERYRLAARTFAYEAEHKVGLPGLDVDVYRVRFPSPVTSPHPENNTVHAEYYRPHGPGPFPGVVVLDILGGDAKVARLMATRLAQDGVAALFVQMAYYGPRRPTEGHVRLLSPNVERTLGAVTQSVLDVRVAAAWLGARPEIDPDRLGVVGTSLGSFVAALAGEMEPRLGRVGIVLGGGGLVDAYYDHPKGRLVRLLYEAAGGSRAKAKALVAPVDPLTRADRLRGKRVLMLAARRDEVVPARMAEALWAAAGEPPLVWYDTTHLGAALSLADGTARLVKHFKD